MLVVRESFAERQVRKSHSDLENSTMPRPSAVIRLRIALSAIIREPNEEILFKIATGGIEDSPVGVVKDAL